VSGSVRNYLRTVFEVEAIQDLAHVIADGRLAEMECFAHLGVGQALGDQGQDFALAGCQISRSISWRLLNVLQLASELGEDSGG
jgi:hypothetical protein